MAEKMEEEKAIGRIIWQGPAFLSNKVWIVWTGQVFRITFAEQDPGSEGPPIFRTAIGLAPGDAVAFSKALAESVKPIEEAIAKQQATDK